MPLSEMGSAPALLGQANEAAGLINQQRQQREKMSQESIQGANKIGQDAIAQKLESEAQKITITEQLANGAKEATGDESWSRAVGTKMDPKIYSSLLQYGSNKKFADQIFQGEDGLYVFNKKTGDAQKIPGSEGRDAAALKKLKEQHKNKIDEIDETGDQHRKTDQAKPYHPSKGRGGSGSSQDPKDKEFLKTYRTYKKETDGFNGVMLDQLSKQDAKRAQELKDKMSFIEKNKQRFDQLQGTDKGQPSGSIDNQAAKNKKAKDWLSQNHPELKNPTDADIAWAAGKIDG